jgi:hypothetical protein
MKIFIVKADGLEYVAIAPSSTKAVQDAIKRGATRASAKCAFITLFETFFTSNVTGSHGGRLGAAQISQDSALQQL